MTKLKTVNWEGPYTASSSIESKWEEIEKGLEEAFVGFIQKPRWAVYE